MTTNTVALLATIKPSHPRLLARRRPSPCAIAPTPMAAATIKSSVAPGHARSPHAATSPGVAAHSAASARARRPRRLLRSSSRAETASSSMTARSRPPSMSAGNTDIAAMIQSAKAPLTPRCTAAVTSTPAKPRATISAESMHRPRRRSTAAAALRAITAPSYSKATFRSSALRNEPFPGSADPVGWARDVLPRASQRRSRVLRDGPAGTRRLSCCWSRPASPARRW